MKESSSSPWVLYVIKCSDNTLYTGITTNLIRRIKEHELGIGAKYTKGRGPFKVIHKEEHKNRSAASKRELEIKKLRRTEKLKLSP